MPPRKRTKTTHAAPPTPPSQAKTPTPADDADEQLLNDPWTDDEEIGLFKGLIKYKPTGIHKHFRLLALHQYMLDNGYIHPKAEHTKPAGIWRKLETLYQLESLDERENARQLEKAEIPEEYKAKAGGSERGSSEEDEDADAYSEAANKIDNDEFDLVGGEFAKLKWERRIPGDEDSKEEREDSPPVLPDINMAREPPVRFTPSFSIEPSETATPTAKRGRGRASTANAKQKPTAAPAANKRRSARQAGSVADEAEQDEDKGEDEEDEEESEEESEEEESEESTPAPRSTRNAKGARGRGGGNTKAQARGRTKRK